MFGVRMLRSFAAVYLFTCLFDVASAQVATVNINWGTFDNVAGTTVSQGAGTYTYTPANDFMGPPPTVWQRLPSGIPETLQFNLGDDSVGHPSLDLTVSSAFLGTALLPGTYDNAGAWLPPINGSPAPNPGVQIGFNHIGDSYNWGSFSVAKADYASNGAVLDFDVSFNIYGSEIDHAAKGNFWSGRLVFSAVPEVGTAGQFLLGLLGATSIIARRKNRFKKVM